MGFIKEFKTFALKGNMMDLAVGVIIGGAFNGIVTSLVNDVIMPFVSLFIGKIDFNNLFVALDGNTYTTLAAAQAAGASVICYGSFITALINFLILAFVVFLMVKGLNKLNSVTLQRNAVPAASPKSIFTLFAVRTVRQRFRQKKLRKRDMICY